jgi:hypothetical protein
VKFHIISASAVDEHERCVSCFSRFYSQGNNQSIHWIRICVGCAVVQYAIYDEDNNYNSDEGNRIPGFNSTIHFVTKAGNDMQTSADHHIYLGYPFSPNSLYSYLSSLTWPSEFDSQAGNKKQGRHMGRNSP